MDCYYYDIPDLEEQSEKIKEIIGISKKFSFITGTKNKPGKNTVNFKKDCLFTYYFI